MRTITYRPHESMACNRYGRDGYVLAVWYNPIVRDDPKTEPQGPIPPEAIFRFAELTHGPFLCGT